ncbi:hypothetical protein DFH27DRAFT_627816, partial [Peziza echinospora]
RKLSCTGATHESKPGDEVCILEFSQQTDRLWWLGWPLVANASRICRRSHGRRALVSCPRPRPDPGRPIIARGLPLLQFYCLGDMVFEWVVAPCRRRRGLSLGIGGWALELFLPELGSAGDENRPSHQGCGGTEALGAWMGECAGDDWRASALCRGPSWPGAQVAANVLQGHFLIRRSRGLPSAPARQGSHVSLLHVPLSPEAALFAPSSSPGSAGRGTRTISILFTSAPSCSSTLTRSHHLCCRLPCSVPRPPEQRMACGH